MATHEHETSAAPGKTRDPAPTLQLADLLEAIPDAALLIDEGERVLAANRDALALFGERGADLTGRALTAVLDLGAAGSLARAARTGPAGRNERAATVRARHAVVPVRVAARPVPGAAGSPVLVVLRTASREEAVVRAFRDVARRAGETAERLAQTAHGTSGQADRIRGAMREILDGTQVQARKVEETVDVIKEFAQSIDRISSHAQESTSRIQAQAVTAREGAAVAEQALARTAGIVEGVRTTGSHVEALAAHFDEVQKILDFVDEVARETNLLAINAAIEAARAGEGGHAFAVVADEVKRLAAHTRESLTDMAGIIRDAKEGAAAIQQETAARVTEVTDGAELIQRALEGFNAVAGDLMDSSEAIAAISQATQEQKLGAGAIVGAIDHVAGVAEETTRSTEDAHGLAEEVAAGMRTLQAAGEELQDIAVALSRTLARYDAHHDEDRGAADGLKEEGS